MLHVLWSLLDLNKGDQINSDLGIKFILHNCDLIKYLIKEIKVIPMILTKLEHFWTTLIWIYFVNFHVFNKSQLFKNKQVNFVLRLQLIMVILTRMGHYYVDGSQSQK